MRETHRLAEINVARMLAPPDHPRMAGFFARLDEINAVADASPGFVWRMQDESGNSSSLRAFGDERVLVNMSVWRSVEALREYVYKSRHVEVLRMRKQWFRALDPPYALWWIPAARIPTLEEGERRWKLLAGRGPTAEAFDFKNRFPPQSA